MGSTLSLFPQSNSNPFSMRRSQTSNEEELEQLYKLMKAVDRRENQTANAEDLRKLMDHWYKLEKNTRRQTSQEMLEHFHKLGKACEFELQDTMESKGNREWDEWELDYWYKRIAVSECNEKLLLFGMKCGWLAVDSTPKEIMRRKLDFCKCIPVAFSFYRCLRKMGDGSIDNFNES